MTKRSSIKDISELTGFSVATVSRVINGKGRYSKETQEKVLAAVKALNYQPNEMARALRTNHSKVIGVIVPDIANEFFAKLLLHLQINLAAANYLTIICNTDEDGNNEEKYLKMLKSHLVCGLICISGYSRIDFAQLKVPTIFIDRKARVEENVENMVLIESDNIGGGKMAAECILNAGCRTPGIISGNPLTSSHGDRLASFRRSFQEGCPGCVIPEYNANKASFDQGYRLGLRLLQENPALDALFCTSDSLALGAQEAAFQLGRKIPQDLKLIGFDDISISASSNTMLTTIRQDYRLMADLGTDVLLKMLEGESDIRRHYLVPVELVRRRTA